MASQLLLSATAVSLSRRSMLAASLLVAFRVPLGRATPAHLDHALNAFVRVDQSGGVTLIMPQVEMGQGIFTALAMVLADEMDADWATVTVEDAPTDKTLYSNGILDEQITGGSTSVRAFWAPLREAGAAARALLVQAAAAQLRVPAARLRTEQGRVFDDLSERSVGYGALAESAAALSLTQPPVLKKVADFKLIGKPLHRLDTPSKANGVTKYGIDAMPTGLRFATLMQSPVLGGKVAHVDDHAGRAIPGVRDVVVLDDVVAVVADNTWAAKCGLSALSITWDDGPNGVVDTAMIMDRLRSASLRDGIVARNDGNVAQALEGGNVVTAEYEMPLLAHTPMEPLNCTVHLQPNQADVWIGTQVMGRTRDAVAKIAGLPAEAVTIHQHLIGGGFGRRLEPDMAAVAARIARHVDGPVKVTWTREEDVRHDYYRPAYHDILTARVEDNRIVAWKHKVAGAAVTARFAPADMRGGVDPDGVDSAKDMPYGIMNVRVEFVREEPPGVNTGWWRGVGPNNNIFAIESFMDDLSRKLQVDPVDFRMTHLAGMPRLRAALELVRERSSWGSPLPSGCGRGVAVQTTFRSYIATVVECMVDEFGEVKLRRVTSCVDTGLAINPDTIVAQMQGGLIYGLTAGLYGEITLKSGRVQQSNFHDYRALRIDQTPAIDIHVIPSTEEPGGIGEAGTVASIAALRNAICAATGIALNRMPVDRTKLAKGSRT